MKNLPLVLASSSVYRAELLKKLNLKFQCFSPEIDESVAKNESPDALVKRLAFTKAFAVSSHFSSSLIIGSDQVCVINGDILGKPHTKEKAFEQLKAASGNCITFYTGICLYNSHTQKAQTDIELFKVHFRQLTDQEIINYIQLENPLDCAGSFKSEGLGISLFSALEGKDPNTLIGLPLIRLCQMLRAEGIDPLN